MPTLADEEAQRTIDEKILQYEAAILELKTRRNTHSAISKLPTELIADIFLIGRRRAQDASLHYTYDSRSRNWLNVSGVCRQWRAIVLDTPRLWCHVDLSWNAERALEILQRAKSVPLLVRCTPNYDSSRFETVAKAVMLQQIQAIHLSVRNQDSLAHFFELNSSSNAPALEVLDLISNPNPVLTLPKDAFWHNMPALRVLELTNILPSSPLPMLPCLTKLQSPVPSASWFIQSLQNTPLIEQISISTLSSTFKTEILTSPQISLPHLISLRVQTYHLGISKALDCIDYPDSATVKFACHSMPVSLPPDFSSLKHVCSRFSDGGGGTSPDQVHIDLTGPLFVMQLVPEEGSSPCLSISLPMPPPQHIVNYVALCSTLPLATAYTLRLIGLENMPIAEWLPLFSRCQEVTTLHLTQCGVEAIQGLLKIDDGKNPPFENLETLVMDDCVFNHSFDEQDERMCKAVISVLTKRDELDMLVPELKIENCTITEDVVEYLGEHLEVDWDGLEMEDEEEDEEPEYEDDMDEDDYYDSPYGDPRAFLFGSF